ncbi:MAG TPA: glycoside hydrolase family 172 protein [Promicromonospora sp.]|uniref:glycoside hydrolase family 172 protein n=1 Tax=Actinotalea caeni TaxID=1348467 RepID=UPI0012E10D53|nr:glycoside hydrolase family 172 protein [Actinotalea caeni]HEV6953451.1 glycoside hydrolase family 172 protein [Promicromonospora sp.]
MTTDHPTPAGAGRYGGYGSSLRDLPRLREHRRMRVSSWDVTGGNDDRLTVQPGETVTLADIRGAGSVNHIWVTVAPLRPAGPDTADHDYLRRLVLRIYWDDAAEPSVLVPLGDFFGVGHARSVNFASAPLQMSPEDGKGFNSFFHMPFATRARFELTSECESEAMAFYYYIDYDAFAELEPGLGRFHASWNRENPTDGVEQGSMTNPEFLFGGHNIGGEGNYTILDTVGRGHYVGCVLNVTNLRHTSDWNWYGEGDDMIFVDGEPWPPRLHGTGTEDYFNTAWCPSQAYAAPYHGITLPGGENWSGQISLYRFHVEDPVTFTSSIRVTIEHGHDNRRSDDLSSTAYWYAEEPARGLTLLPVEQRLPRLA